MLSTVWLAAKHFYSIQARHLKGNSSCLVVRAVVSIASLETIPQYTR